MDFFASTADVPFSRAQYYRYLKKAREGGEQSLRERKRGCVYTISAKNEISFVQIERLSP